LKSPNLFFNKRNEIAEAAIAASTQQQDQIIFIHKWSLMRTDDFFAKAQSPLLHLELFE
jgi:hypothetical protein